jgi:hypothetical protein
LYYEAELATLENELRTIEAEDHNCQRSPRSAFAVSWRSLSSDDEQNPHESVRDGLQWNLVLRIRNVLRDYSKP